MIKTQYLSSDLALDPGKVARDTSVDTNVTTATTPRGDTDELVVVAGIWDDEWATRVTLAGVLVVTDFASADHLILDDLEGAVVGNAVGVRLDEQVDFAQVLRH